MAGLSGYHAGSGTASLEGSVRAVSQDNEKNSLNLGDSVPVSTTSGTPHVQAPSICQFTTVQLLNCGLKVRS